MPFEIHVTELDEKHKKKDNLLESEVLQNHEKTIIVKAIKDLSDRVTILEEQITMLINLANEE